MTLSLRTQHSPSSTSRLAFAMMFVCRGGLGDGRLTGERRTWDTVLFRSPRSEIRDLTTLGAEWTPGVCLPSRGSAAQGADHGCSVTSEPNEVQSLNAG